MGVNSQSSFFPLGQYAGLSHRQTKYSNQKHRKRDASAYITGAYPLFNAIFMVERI